VLISGAEYCPGDGLKAGSGILTGTVTAFPARDKPRSNVVQLRVSALMIAHVIDIGIWAAFIAIARIPLPQIEAFEFAFENYVALGYGDVVASAGWRLTGPIISLNGLLLIGWSVAAIFEVMKMADVQIRRRDKEKD